MPLSEGATFYCPACGSEMDDRPSNDPEVALVRCILCAMTWTITTSDECHAILKAWKDESQIGDPN